MTTTTVYLGLSQSDQRENYYPMIDGWRPGVTQTQVAIVVPTEAVADRSIDEVAEALFVATNHPAPLEAGGLATVLAEALSDQDLRPRALSVGDTVVCGPAAVACDRSGWTRLV